MRLLHTADWHLGKVLKGVDRLPEQRAVLAEIVTLAADQAVDLVLVAGDVFESGAPPPEAQRLAFETLLALRATGADVVVIAGNHDNADAFEAVRPVFAAAGITVLGRTCPPDAGGVRAFAAARSGEPVHLALLPFTSQRGIVRAVDLFGATAADANDRYAERLAKVVARLTDGFGTGTVNLLVAHGTVTGARFGGGEREAQSIFDYHVPATVFPATATYVALGHLHRTQEVPARCPAWYAGSPVAVDFGEEAASPSVLLVDAAPGAPARVRRVELTSPRTLRTVSGTVAELEALASEVGDALLRVVVTEPARAGLGDEVRALLPNAIDVQVAAPTAVAERRPSRAGRSTIELFHQYLTERDVDDPAVEALFAELLDAATTGGGG
jgi:DNA repair protein SbcD/Mre11